MSKVRDLFGRGNTKLGESIHTWSLPAVLTCPGRSAVCEAVCYAKGGRFRTRHIRLILAGNLQASTEDDFEDRAAGEVRRRCVHVLRLHVGGDFYSAAYARKWVRVARRCPRTRFYAYTRSWRDESILPALWDLAELPNVRLWFSTDAETGLPSSVPPAVRLAHLRHEPESDVPDGAGVVFRVRRLREEPPGRFPLGLACPNERPDAAGLTCGECQRCWR